MRGAWRNWAGDQRCAPAAIERPGTREELRAVVRRAAERGRTVRGVGSGHSFTEIALTDGVMVRLEPARPACSTSIASAGLVKVEAGIVLGELNRRLDAARAGVREPRRHRPPDARRLDRDRHPRHRRAASATSPRRSRRSSSCSPTARARDLARLRPGGAGARRGSGSARSALIYAVTIRASRPSPSPRRQPAAARRDARPPRRARRRAATTSSSTSSPTRETALCRESRRTDEPPQPRGRAAVYAQEVMLENWVGGALRARQRRAPLAGPAPRAAGRRRDRALDQGRSQLPGLRLRAADQVHGDGVRDPARARGRGGAPGARRRGRARAPRSRSRSRSASPPPTTPCSAPPTPATAATSPCTRTAGSTGGRTSARSRRSWTPTAAGRTGASATSRPPRRWRPATRAGTTSRPLRDRLDPERRFANDYTERVLGR